MAKTKEKVVKDAIDPEVIVGSHLTVYRYANGKTVLEWDDAALTRDVEKALASVATESPKKAKKPTVKKPAAKKAEPETKPTKVAKKSPAKKTETKSKTVKTKTTKAK